MVLKVVEENLQYLNNQDSRKPIEDDHRNVEVTLIKYTCTWREIDCYKRSPKELSWNYTKWLTFNNNISI
jgi:hypothetical protein